MKKLSLCLLILGCFLLTGCGKSGEGDILKKLEKQIENNKGYIFTGSLEILNNDDIYNYDVESAYMEDNYYKVSLKNISNDHEQIILKNDDGVYV